MAGPNPETIVNESGLVARVAAEASSLAAWRARFRACLVSPGFWLAAAAVVCVVLLLLPVKLAIGGYYWDVYLYPDAAWRIANSQIPHVDFFAPAGALEYYSYAFANALFPNGQHLLLAQWSYLLLTLPLMAWIVRDVARESRYLALAIVLPFVFYSIMPINSKEVYPLAGVDGYGVYNRHSCLLMYVLVAAFVFVPAGRKLAILVGVLLAALFFTKITGFLAGAMIVIHAMLARRFGARAMAQAGALLIGLCIAIEIPTGLVSAYLSDIATLAGMNSGGILERLRSPVAMYLDVLTALFALALLLTWVDRKRILFLCSQRAGIKFGNRIAAIFDHDAVWISGLAVTGILFETQNTGSLAFIFLWPFLAQLFARWFPRQRDRRTAVLLLIALAALPMSVPMLHRATRVIMATIFYDAIDAPALSRYGATKAKTELLERGVAMKDHYGRVDGHYRRLSEAGHQSSYLLYSEIDYQISWLAGAADAANALRAWEKQNGVDLKKLITLDFVDIFTPLLERKPVRHISIGMAAERTVPPLDEKRLAAAKSADGVLVPLCPVTPVRLSLLQTFQPVLAGRKRIALTPCWDLLIKP